MYSDYDSYLADDGKWLDMYLEEQNNKNYMKEFDNYPFVEENIALLARENGFNEDCNAFYFENKLIDCTKSKFNNSSLERGVSAPMYFQLIDWLDEKGFYISISCLYANAFISDIKTKDQAVPYVFYESVGSRIEAQEQAIYLILDKYIINKK